MAVSRYNYVRSVGDAVVQVIVVDTTAELPGTHVEGSLVYDKQTDILYTSDGAVLTAVGAGTGTPGTDGAPGIAGEDGYDFFGVPGATGAQGTAGSTGATGSQGERGVPGADGEDGEAFFGVPGNAGPTGNTGNTGDTGAPGSQGAAGIPGLVGEDGAEFFGVPGARGADGAAGSNGAAGAAGDRGAPGSDGDDGDSFFGVPGNTGAGTAVTFVRKATTESSTSNTTLQPDDELSFAVGANETWVGSFFVLYDGAATNGDIKFSLTVPTGATMNLSRIGPDPSDDTIPFTDIDNDVATSAAGALGTATVGAGSTLYVMLDFIVRTAGTAGVVTLTWAQVVSNLTATRVLADSYLQAWPAARVTTYGLDENRYATGSFVVPTGSFRMMVKNLTLTGTDRATLAGTARLRID